MGHSSEIQFSVAGPIGRMHLTNEKSLNSLTQAMCLGMHEHLSKWATDAAIHAVVVTAEGERAFCAGGDVVQVSTAGRSDPIAAREFFRVEYAMDLAIAGFPKPYICLVDGIVMGGGVMLRGEVLISKIREHFQNAINGYLQHPKFNGKAVNDYIVLSRFKNELGMISSAATGATGEVYGYATRLPA